MEYKVWVYIEEIDEDEDHYQDIDLPESIGTFDTVEAAQTFVAALPNAEG